MKTLKLLVAILCIACTGCVTLGPSGTLDENAKLLPVNATDQSGTIQRAIDGGQRTLVFAPGYHRINKTLVIPEGTTRIVGTNTTIDFTMGGWAILTRGAIEFQGVTLAHSTDSWLTLATGVGGSPSIQFDYVDCGVRTTAQNIATISATNSTFRAVTGWHNASIRGCEFRADTYITGNTQFTNNEMRGRLVSSGAGLNKALIKNCHWREVVSGINEGEALLLEDCNVTDSVFEDLWFHQCGGPVFQFWGWSNGSMTNCTVRRIISDGPSFQGVTLVALNGTVEGNTFDQLMFGTVTRAVIVGKGCGSNSFSNLYVNNVAPWPHHAGFWNLSADETAMWRDGIQAWPWEAKDMTDPKNITVFSDYSTGTRWQHVRVWANGATVTNHPERFTDLVERP